MRRIVIAATLAFASLFVVIYGTRPSPAIEESGTWIVFACSLGEYHSGLVLYSLDHGDTVMLTSDFGLDADYPKWSPNGERIAARFEGYRLGLVNVRSRDISYLDSSFEHVHQVLAWSPDSEFLAIAARRAGQESGTYIIDLRGIPIEQIGQTAQIRDLVWLDSQTILYVDPDHTGRLLAFDVSSRSTRTVATLDTSIGIVAIRELGPVVTLLATTGVVGDYTMRDLSLDGSADSDPKAVRPLDLLEPDRQVIHLDTSDKSYLLYSVGRFPYRQLGLYEMQTERFRVLTDSQCSVEDFDVHTFVDPED